MGLAELIKFANRLYCKIWSVCSLLVYIDRLKPNKIFSPSSVDHHFDRGYVRIADPSRWHFEERGDGPPLLLLHGLGASSFSWRHNVGPIARHFRVLAPDLPPHGRSPAALDADYTVAALARAVLAFLDHLALPRAALMGNSLGGGLALLLARDHPERVSALVLLAPAAALTQVPWIFYPLRLPLLGYLAAGLLGAWIIPPALRLAYHRRELITPEVVSGYAASFRDPRRRLALGRLCRQLQILPLDQVDSLLREISQPTALIWGTRDRILPVGQAYWVKERLARCEFHLLPEVGHAPQEEDPEQVNKIIIAFLSRSLKN
jgi:pimeloyl-ACP methyl ester carboxylesterase